MTLPEVVERRVCRSTTVVLGAVPPTPGKEEGLTGAR